MRSIAEHRTWYLEGIADRAIHLDDGRAAGIYTMEKFAGLTRAQRFKTGIRPVRLDAFDVLRISAPTEFSRSCEVHLRDIMFSYPRCSECALFVGDARFGAGRVEMIVGDNGAGKSTLASVICGLAKENCGNIEINGASIKEKKQLSFSYEVMQEINHQLFCDSVEDEIVLGAARLDTSDLESVPGRMDLCGVRNRHPLTLSGGQKQRRAIAATVSTVSSQPSFAPSSSRSRSWSSLAGGIVRDKQERLGIRGREAPKRLRLSEVEVVTDSSMASASGGGLIVRVGGKPCKVREGERTTKRSVSARASLEDPSLPHDSISLVAVICNRG